MQTIRCFAFILVFFPPSLGVADVGEKEDTLA
jgi:hypothetical protein